jgi:diguanylate cyclase (GGDEF)-like protein
MHTIPRSLKENDFLTAVEWAPPNAIANPSDKPLQDQYWHAHLPEIVEAAPDFVAIMDDRGLLQYLNRAGRSMLGFSETENISGANMASYHPAEDSHRLLAEAFPTARREGVWHGESSMRAVDGREISVSQTVLAHARPDGSAPMFSAIVRDISKSKQVEQDFRHRAVLDAPNLEPNPVLLQARLERELTLAQRSHAQVAVVLLALDNFKRIRGSLGDMAGYEVLHTVAQRLTECLPNDVVVRHDDDTFCLAIGALRSTERMSAVMHMLDSMLARPIQAGGQTVICGFNAGISIYPNDGNTPSDLIEHADAALKHSKLSGTGQYHFYETEMNTRCQELLALETDLHRALDRGEFLLHYQPQFHLCTGRIAGFEALLRWQHPARGLILPPDFLPMLEASDRILTVGEWAVRQACAESRKLRDIGGTTMPISVNISARQFRHHHLVNELRHILRDEKMPPEDLELEITESTIMDDVQAAGEILAALDGLGVRLAIDDFGTGYSSLAYLKRFPINALKIDRAFIQDLPWEDNSSTLTEASISLGHKLGLEVIAEGVETAKQFQFLRAYGCDMIQGHYFGLPLPFAEAAQFAMSHQPVSPS